MLLSRKTFSVGAASAYAAIAAVRFPGGAAEFNYKFSTEWVTDLNTTVRLTEAVKKINDEANGRLEVRLFPNGSLGSQGDQLTQLRLGAIEFYTAGDFLLANTAPIAGITATPFAFPTRNDAWTALDGPLGKYRRGGIEKLGVYPFAKSWDLSYRQVTNSLRPLRTPDDAKGMKIRTPDSPIMTSLFKALGATPTVVSANETYTALQTHLIDGSEQPLQSVEALKLYEVQKYASYTNHIWTGYTMLANAAAWQKLPQALRDIVERNIDNAGSLSNNDSVRLDATQEATLTRRGVIFNRADIPSFKAAVRTSGLYAQWKSTYGNDAWTLLERAVGRLS